MEQTPAWTPGSAPPAALRVGPLRLDRWLVSEAPAHYAAVDASRAHLEAFMPWSRGYSLDKSEGFLAAASQGWEGRTAFEYRLSGAALGSDRVLGGAGLMARRGLGVLEIGYWVRADAVRRRIALRAAVALTDAGLRLPGVDRIEIHHDPRNAPSGAIPDRLGFVREPDPVPGPPGREDEEMVCWTLSGAQFAASAVAVLLATG